jgi:hypothetical protein
VAYVSRQAGPGEVFVRPFPAGSGKWQISTQGGIEPNWSRDGRELYFRDRDILYAVAVEARGTFSFGSPKRIASALRSGLNTRSYSPSPDARRFLALPGWETSNESSQVNLALRWDREVVRRLGTR